MVSAKCRFETQKKVDLHINLNFFSCFFLNIFYSLYAQWGSFFMCSAVEQNAKKMEYALLHQRNEEIVKTHFPCDFLNCY